MGTKAETTMSLDNQEFIRRLAKQNELLVKNVDVLTKGAAAAKNTAGQTEKLSKEQREANRIIETSLTPQQKYARNLLNIQRLQAKGLVTQNQANFARNQEADILSKAGSNANTATAAITKFVSGASGVASVASGLLAAASLMRAEY